MKRIFFAIALMFSANVFADTCKIMNSGLPDSVVQKLKTDCESLRLDQITKEAVEKVAGSVPAITPERITGWAQVAEGFAKAMGAAAQQLNVSVNDFIKTPAGMITIGFIVLKAFGAGLMKVVVIIFLTIVTYWINRHIWTRETIEVEKSFFNMKWSKTKRVLYNFKEMPDFGGWLSVLGTLCYLIASTLILLNIG